MKKNHTLMIIFLISSLLLAATVHAADDTQSYTDPEGDVMDESTKLVDRPNIDIVEITYFKDGKDFTIKLTVSDEGIIENKGDLEATDIESAAFVMYVIAVDGKNGSIEKSYAISYMNQICTLLINQEERTADYSIDDNVLTVTFTLEEENYVIESVSAYTNELTGFSYYADFYTEEETELYVDAGSSYEGSIGEEINFTGMTFGGSRPYSCLWDFDDGTTSTEQFPIHQFDTAKDYSITFTVTDNEGTVLTSTASVTIFDDGTGENGDNNGGGSSNNLVLFAVVIGVIAIIGVAVVVIIIKR